MATLNVKNFPEALHRKLRAQARRHGRTIGSEVAAIIAEELTRLHWDPVGDPSARKRAPSAVASKVIRPAPPARSR